MFYKNDLGIVKILHNIKRGLTKDFDYVLVVVGDTGMGKSHFILHLLEAWTKIIGKDINEDTIKNINVSSTSWLKRFTELSAFDVNIFDEGAYGLGSKQFAEKFSKTLEMLFQVIRAKKFLTVIAIPNFFRLNKYFREDRIRGLVYINKRGEYKFYHREQVIRINQLNERKLVKKVDIVRPLHYHNYPMYKGVLLEDYTKMKNEGVDDILETVIELNEKIEKTKDLSNAHLSKVIKPVVLRYRNEAQMTYKNIRERVMEEYGIKLDNNRIAKMIDGQI